MSRFLKKVIPVFLFATIAIACLPGVYMLLRWLVLKHTPQLAASFIQKGNVSGLGEFGDSAGFSNALFSALAFVAVVVTLLIQVWQNNKNNRIARRAQFENNFFQMTGMLEEIISHLEIESSGGGKKKKKDKFIYKDFQLYSWPHNSGEMNNDETMEEDVSGSQTYRGRQVFRYVYEVFPSTSGFGVKGIVSANPEYDVDQMRATCFDGSLDHYFRYLYRILKYVDTSELIGNRDRYDYACILRGQLSCYELLVLFFNCLGMDNDKFKHLIEKYSMFNNLRVDFLPTPEMIEIYSAKQEGEIIDKNYKNSSKEYSAQAFKRFKKTYLRRNVKAIKIAYTKARIWHNSIMNIMLPHL